MRSFMRYLIPIVIILAAIGLVFELIFNPVKFLTNILVSIGIITLIYLIYRAVTAKRQGTSLFSSHSGPSRAQLTKAKRTSTKRMAPLSGKRGKPVINTTKKKSSRRSINRKDDHQLTVIEGNKNKKKNRALF